MYKTDMFKIGYVGNTDRDGARHALYQRRQICHGFLFDRIKKYHRAMVFIFTAIAGVIDVA